MKKLILIILIIIAYQPSAIAQIENHNFTAKQKKEMAPLSKVLPLLPNYPNNFNTLQNITSKKIRRIESVDEGGIKTTLIENWQNDAWINYKLTTFSFDLDNHETGYLVQNWDNGSWVNSFKYGTILNDQTYPERDSIQFWENNNWQNKFRNFYTYNSNNDVTILLTQMWNDTTKGWDNLMNLIINYDDEFKITENYTEVWSDTGWSSFQREFYNYDENTKLCTERKTEMNMGDEWMDMSRITYQYNNRNLIIEQLNESWIFFQSKWVKSLRYQYEYNSNDQEIVKYDEEWDLNTGQKTVYKKISTSYIGDFISEELTQEWRDNDWVNTDLDTYTIEDQRITVTLWQKWDDVNNKWYNFQRWTNTYGNSVSVESRNVLPSKFKLYQNYPNPFNPTTIIKYTIPPNVKTQNNASQLVQLRVYDILGKEVTTLVNEVKQPGNYEVELNAINLTSGIYFYTLNFGNKSITKKCLLIK